MRARWITFLWIVALAMFVLLGAMNLYWGELNQDEGWYLYAARMVRQGALPYRDFAFTQGPVMPFVYSGVYTMVDRFGMAGGRAVTAVFGLLAALASAWLAGRIASRRSGVRAVAGVLAFLLLACNVYHSYFTTVVKTYSLAALLLMLGLVALSFSRGRGGAAVAFFSGLLIALAAGVRLSAGAALPVVGVYLLLCRKALGDSRWIAFGVGGLLGLAGWTVPFLAVAPEGFRFAMVEYHTARSAGSVMNLLVYKAGFISRFVQAYFVPVGLMVAVILFKWFYPVPVEERDDENVLPRFNTVLWISAVAITTVHFLAPFPYEDYQVFVMPLVAAALAVSLVRIVISTSDSDETAGAYPLRLLLVVVFILSTAAAFSSPINQNWFARGRDRIWWPLREQSPLKQLSNVAIIIRDLSGDGGLLLTQDTYIAVEARLDVPAGLEMGPFCYYPEMDAGRAKKLRVMNREMMLDLLRATEAPLAAFSGYGLAIRGPEVLPVPADEFQELWAIVEERYEPLFEVEHFGQGDTTLRVLDRKSAKEDPTR